MSRSSRIGLGAIVIGALVVGGISFSQSAAEPEAYQYEMCPGGWEIYPIGLNKYGTPVGYKLCEGNGKTYLLKGTEMELVDATVAVRETD